jgi:4-diphosphocytidyl-2-C-methyl-D-erythritol kinase
MIRSAMQAIDLCDDVTVSYDSGNSRLKLTIGISMTLEPYVATAPGDFISDQEDNIAYKAAGLYCLMYCPDLKGRVDIQIHKRIPAAAGLAGGSADAAAVVLALDHLLTGGEYHSLEELAGFAVRLGADVPFCIASAAKNNPGLAYYLIYKDYDDEYSIMTSSALCEGIGEILTPTPSAGGKVILIKPDIEVSTPLIYRLYDEKMPDAAKAKTDINACPLLTLWDENALEPVTTAAFPAVGKLLDEVRQIADSASLVYMTGSGPTIVAVYPDERDGGAISDFDSLQAKFKHRADVSAVLICKLLS